MSGKVSDTQVTVKACGPPVILIWTFTLKYKSLYDMMITEV